MDRAITKEEDICQHGIDERECDPYRAVTTFRKYPHEFLLSTLVRFSYHNEEKRQIGSEKLVIPEEDYDDIVKLELDVFSKIPHFIKEKERFLRISPLCGRCEAERQYGMHRIPKKEQKNENSLK